MDVARRRIILTVTNDLTYDQRMQRICTSLSEAGYEVELVGRELSTSKPLDKFHFLQTRLKCLFNKGKLFYLEYNIRLFIYLLFHRADIICGIDLDTLVACYYGARLRGTKIVYDAHEYFPEVPEVVRRPRIQRIWRWVERTYITKVDMVYTTTQSIADVFQQKYKIPVHTVRNLPLLQEQPAINYTGKPYLLYQGALNEGRGIEQLIHAMNELDIGLYLVGDGDLTEQLKKMTADLKLEDKVKFLGYRKPTELKQITAGAYIGLNLLENSGLSYYYSLANKFSDYIHAGIPQICIAFPEYRRLNDAYNVALLIENLDQDTIKTAVKRLVDDKEMYEKFKENCLVCRCELNWQNEERKMIALYEQLR